jgi:hypothetical protein
MSPPWQRARVFAGLVTVTVGAIWVGGGLGALRDAARATIHALPVLAVAAGLVLLVRAAVPRGRLGGPLLVLIVGLVALAFQRGVLKEPITQNVLPVAIVLGGFVIALTARTAGDGVPASVYACTSVILPRVARLWGKAPTKVILRCVLGSIVIDLSEATFHLYDRRVTFDLTMAGGHIEIIIPANWHLRVERIQLAHNIHYEGVASDPEGAPPLFTGVRNLAVLNIQGYRGAVTITRRQLLPELSVAGGPSEEPAPPLGSSDSSPAASSSAPEEAEAPRPSS